MRQERARRSLRRLGILIVLGAAVFGILAFFRAGPAPEISVEAALPGIGKRTPIRVVVSEPKRGLSDVRIEFVQGERVEQLDARAYVPRKPWQFWGDCTRQDEFALEVGSETLDRLEEGPATVRVVADRATALLRYPQPAVRELTLDVKLRPPALQVLSSFTYVKQGGCEAVVYTVGESSVRDGVRSGDWWFPGYPLPGDGGRQRFALFAAPYDLGDPQRIRLAARDDVGNEARVAFVDQFTPRPPGADRIRISDQFMERVVPAIMAQTPGLKDRGDPLENYLAVNRELREQNNSALIELSAQSAEAFLWKRTFLQMRNAKVTSDFADRRTYLYNGKEIDRQFHLGFDLASTRAAEIQAANDGAVVLARYFGIYGNAVVIDHGYGLMSLYGHLSSIAVGEGEKAERGQVIGRSGATGLAGGDHLHFTMMLQGLPVDSREWWDGHWIHDRLFLKLGAALPFEE
jgi:murein DD-endopeptidase MepM/ murein hydrolase activator NlpD